MPRLPVIWSNPAQAVLYFMLILFALGSVNIFSASFVAAARDYQDSYWYIKRHLIFFSAGLLVMFVAARLDYRKYRPVVVLLLTVTVLTLVAVPIMGMEANGAKRWLRLGPLNFQPSELAKLASIMMSSAWLALKLDKREPVTLASWPVILALIMFGLVYKQPDFGTALVIVTLCLLLYLIAGLSRRDMLALGVGGVIALGYLSVAASYRAERIAAWLNPWAYEQTVGYQTVQALMAIGSGGATGSGLGLGASKFLYLPEAHTDFAFAVLGQEMGFIGVVAVIILFGLIGFYGVQVAVKAPDNYGMLLAIGITAMVVGQAAGNMAMVCGLLPVTGVPLPFISYGGTSLVVNMAAIGILVSIGRKGNVSGTPAAKQRPIEELQARRKLRLVKS